MKRCPYCAEDIQDAAIVCKHCRRDLDAPKPEEPQSRNAGRFALGCLGVSILMILLIGFLVNTGTNGPPVLAVSAARGATTFALTNREDVTLSQCEATVLDQGDAEWVAEIPGVLVPSQTVAVAWSAFKANGQPMPGYIGRERKFFTVSCTFGDTNGRRSAGLAF